MFPIEVFAAMSAGAPAKSVRTIADSATHLQVTLAPTPVESSVAATGSATGYLPECGPSALRFFSARGWPPPYPETEAAENSREKTPVASAPVASDPSAAPADDSTSDEEARPEAIDTPAGGKPPAVKIVAKSDTLLTSDLVLGYLENRPNKHGGIPVSFQPALSPESASGDAKPAETP